MSRWGYVFLAVLVFTQAAVGQRMSFFGAFPSVSQTGSIGKRMAYNLYASATIDALPQRINEKNYPASALQYYLQPSLVYKVTPRVQVGVGYAYVKHDLFGLLTNENRVWVQTVLSQPIGPIQTTHRIRYEERYPLNLQNQKWAYATLLRYQVGGTLPLYDTKTRKTGFYASAFNEFFFCLTGANNGPISAKNAFYGEDWVYGGLGYNTGKLGRIELGYLFQDLIRNPAQDHRHLHLIQVSWATNFSLQGLGTWLYSPILMP